MTETAKAWESAGVPPAEAAERLTPLLGRGFRAIWGVAWHRLRKLEAAHKEQRSCAPSP